MPNRAKWTILTYIAAHNDLHMLGDRSLNQLVEVGSTSDVMHGVLFDGLSGATRYILGDPGLVLQQDSLDDFDSGDPERLIETAQWLFSQYPAERYGLILWSHGTGWAPREIERVLSQIHGDVPQHDSESEAHARSAMPGSRILFRSSLTTMLKPDQPTDRAILFDDGSGHALDTLQLEQVTNEIAGAIRQKLDFIGLDACLMATIEVAYQLRASAAYLVASEDLVPGLSWPYDRIMTGLRESPDMLARDLADRVVMEYAGFYRDHPPAPGNGEVTKIALDLSRIDHLIPVLKRLADTLAAGMPSVINCLEHAQNTTYIRETNDEKRGTSRFDYHLWDIVSVAGELATNCDNPAVSECATETLESYCTSEVVVRAGHLGTWLDGIGGMSVYWIPPKHNRPRHISPFYRDVAFARDAAWNTMLEAYRYPTFC